MADKYLSNSCSLEGNFQTCHTEGLKRIVHLEIKDSCMLLLLSVKPNQKGDTRIGQTKQTVRFCFFSQIIDSDRQTGRLIDIFFLLFSGQKIKNKLVETSVIQTQKTNETTSVRMIENILAMVTNGPLYTSGGTFYLGVCALWCW